MKAALPVEVEGLNVVALQLTQNRGAVPVQESLDPGTMAAERRELIGLQRAGLLPQFGRGVLEQRRGELQRMDRLSRHRFPLG